MATNIEKTKPTSIWRKLLGFIIGLLTGITLTIVYQNGQVNVAGENNIVTNHQVKNEDTLSLWETQRFHTTDSLGRKIEFEISILSQEKRWEFGNSEYLENHQLFDEFFPEYLKKLSTINDCMELISIGVASQEGKVQDEFTRADKRADKILEILRPISKGKILYKLNLGRYSSIKLDSDTSKQRKVIIGGIKKRDPAMTFNDIRYALFNELKKEMEEKLGLSLSDYNDFYFTNPN